MVYIIRPGNKNIGDIKTENGTMDFTDKVKNKYALSVNL